MIIRVLSQILFVCIIISSFFSCKQDKIILHADIGGAVTDSSSKQPLSSADVILIPGNDTVETTQDGTYLFKNLTPGNYEIRVSKSGYASLSRYRKTEPEKTYRLDFALIGVPVPKISDNFLDFGFDTSSLSFKVSNAGQGRLTYSFLPAFDWIKVYPSSGDVAVEKDSITVTIDRSGLAGGTYKGMIKALFVAGEDFLQDTIHLFINGIMDNKDGDGNVYNVVKIGNQLWLKENLKTTRYRDGTIIPNVTKDNDWEIMTGAAYCWYNNDLTNKDIFGALYNWYAVSNGDLCPLGWRVPSSADWITLENYMIANGYNYDGSLSGNKIGKALATSTYWCTVGSADAIQGAIGNTGYPSYRNKSNFSALPGGYRDPYNGSFSGSESGCPALGYWWSSTPNSLTAVGRNLDAYKNSFNTGNELKNNGLSVRCVRDY